VLHSLSFIDDPTRILRAARLESRLGFRLDPRSEELIDDALPLLKRVSGDRIRHEFELIFREEEPERAICRLDELGALDRIHSNLTCDRWLERKYRFLRDALDRDLWGLEPGDMLFMHLALLGYGLDQEGLKALSRRLKLKREQEKDLLVLLDLQGRLPELSRLERASRITHLLEPYPTRVLAVIWVASESDLIRKRLLRYQTDWRIVEAALTGSELKAMGLRPGPLFGDLLDTLRDARLDEQVSTQGEEEALVLEMLASRNQTEEDG